MSAEQNDKNNAGTQRSSNGGNEPDNKDQIIVPTPETPPEKPKVKKIDPVNQALEETFPASDPPANY